jgi:beta-lactamase regulating signal transducer with metallopeptidase domain/uncharacterized GH25 family protein
VNRFGLQPEGTVVLHVMLAHADSAGGRWVAWVAAASLEAALLFALVGLAWMVIRRRVAPQVGYGLFLLVPLKLLIPVAVTVPPVLARWTPSAVVASWSKPADTPATIDRPAGTPPAIATHRSAPREAVFPLPPIAATTVAVATNSPPVATRAGQATARTRPVADMPGPAWATLAMTVWGLGVVFLTGRFLVAQWRFRARLRRASPVDASRWGLDFEALCRSAGVSQAVRLQESDSVAAPAVWGVFRPTILLPRGIAATLTPTQLHWVLLHELEHVRRRDLVVVTLQRFASILHFFNPVVWLANRVIHELREYACDDAALALGQVSGVESGEAFVRVLRHTGRNRRGLEGALGILGLDSRACCLRRACRLLDDARPIRTMPGMRWAVAWILLAALTVPHLRAGSGGGETQVDLQETPAHKNQAGPGGGETQEFALRVVGPGGQAVPGVEVELRTDPHVTAGQVRRGIFVRERRYGSVVATDAQGQLTVELPQAPKSLDVFITTPGFGPYWAGWSSQTHEEPVPTSFTAELEPAWTVGGVVVDDTGKPIAGATVSPFIEFKKRPGVTTQLGSGTQLKTDAAGRWHFDSIPDSMAEVDVAIDHPGHRPVQRPLARNRYGLEHAKDPTVRMVLPRGLTVTGKITDEAGKPIVGARVRTKYSNFIREATTGPDGVYHLVGCEPAAVRVVASAKGKATDMKELTIDPAMGPVDFQMKPGGHVRIRVVDAQGKPVPRTRILFQRWRGSFQYFEFNDVDQYADANGVWEWHEAPLDEIKADICPPQGMQLVTQTITARPEEYVFHVTGPLVVSGKVVDAATGKPVDTFRVIAGWRWRDGPASLFWNQRGAFDATGGHYQIRQDRVESALLVRIEADGYQAAVSPEIRSTEGNVTVDFALKRGKVVAATVLTPDGHPAAKAKLALSIEGSQIAVKNGDIDDTSTYCARAETDDAGRFHFPTQDTGFQLIITHPAGFARVRATPDTDLAPTIRLEAWARVEGTFRVGKTPVAGVPIRLESNGALSYGQGLAHIYTQHGAVTGPAGRFVFDRVIPGKGSLGRNITLIASEGATEVTSSCMVPVEFVAGKTLHVELGGSGRPVIGKLQPPSGAPAPVRWSFALVMAVPSDAKTRENGAFLTATVDRDGKFRIDDVPAGSYTLSVRFNEHEAGYLQGVAVKVPPSEGAAVGPPVDLGTLNLKRR